MLPENHEPLLRGVTAALQVLLESPDFATGMEQALRELGLAAGVDRVYLFRIHDDPSTGESLLTQKFEWVREGIEPQIANPELQNMRWEGDFLRWLVTMRDGGYIAGKIDEMPEGERDLLRRQQILSIACVPVFCERELWGLIGFDACRKPVEWPPDIIKTLQAAASGVGAALARQRFESEITMKAEELRRSRRVALSLMEDARNAERAAAAASEAKSSFLAMMSHEMRTPLNSIIGFTDLILNADADPTIRDYAENVRASGRLLLSLVNDVLDFARIEANQVTLVPEVGDVSETVDIVMASMRPIAEAKGLMLSASLLSKMPGAIVLDFARLHQILLNVIGNALKFTDSGSVELRGKAEQAEGGRIRLQFEVEDTGAGMAPGVLERIFEPFVQANEHVHRRHGGTGLGLAICRNLCRRMGGDITVESVEGKGSRFSFDVTGEAAGAPASKRLEVSRMVAAPADRRLRLLVVDDVAVNRQLVSAVLRKAGHQCEVAESGEEALIRTAGGQFDAIIMDVLLPGISGLEATRQILARTNGHPPPWIIGLSADVMPENRNAAEKAGMHAFLTKPLHATELLQKLADLPVGPAPVVEKLPVSEN